MIADEKPTLAQFVAALSRYGISFSRQLAAEGRETAANQKQLWRGLINRLMPPAANAEGYLARLADTVDRSIDNNPIQIEDGPDGVKTFRSHFPMLLGSDIETYAPLFSERPWPAIAAIVLALRFPIWGSTPPPHAEALEKLLSDPRIQAAMFEVQIELLGEDPRKGVFQDLLYRAEQADALLKDAGSTRTGLHNAEIARAERFTAFLKKAQDDIDAARKQATEAGILLNATRLWARKAVLHGLGFWLGLVVMAAMVCTGLYLIFLHGPAFLTSLPKKPDGEVTYVTVALITICAIAAGWLLRFIGRFVTQNMVLQTDADQRRVMLQTYLALVGEKDAKMEQADRTLILNAVFRPLPGHQSEDVAPPTLLDLAESAVPGGDKK